MHTDILSSLIISKIHFASTMYTEVKTRLKRKDRSAWAVVLKYEGQTVYNANGKECISNANNIVVLPKGCDYSWHCTESGHFHIIEFESDKTFSEIISFNVKNPEQYVKAFKRIELCRALKNRGYKLEELKELYGILSALVKADEQGYLPSAREQKINYIIEYIAENYNKRMTNDELAKAVGISNVYFRKLFKTATGLSPASYIKSIRIKKAEEMLKSDFSSVSDIAVSLGYNNVYEFSRDFKKQMGVSPTNYNKQRKAGA